MFSALAELRSLRLLTSYELSVGASVQASCTPKIVAGEKLTRILARRLLQRSLASVLSQLDHRTSLSSVENPRGRDEIVTSATPRSLFHHSHPLPLGLLFLSISYNVIDFGQTISTRNIGMLRKLIFTWYIKLTF